MLWSCRGLNTVLQPTNITHQLINSSSTVCLYFTPSNPQSVFTLPHYNHLISNSLNSQNGLLPQLCYSSFRSCRHSAFLTRRGCLTYRPSHTEVQGPPRCRTQCISCPRRSVLRPRPPYHPRSPWPRLYYHSWSSWDEGHACCSRWPSVWWHFKVIPPRMFQFSISISFLLMNFYSSPSNTRSLSTSWPWRPRCSILSLPSCRPSSVSSTRKRLSCM